MLITVSCPVCKEKSAIKDLEQEDTIYCGNPDCNFMGMDVDTRF